MLPEVLKKTVPVTLEGVLRAREHSLAFRTPVDVNTGCHNVLCLTDTECHGTSQL